MAKEKQEKQRLEVVFVPVAREMAQYGLDGRILHDLDDMYKFLELVGVEGGAISLKDAVEWDYHGHRIVLSERWSFLGEQYLKVHGKRGLVFECDDINWLILPTLVVSVKDLNSGKVLYEAKSSK